MTIEEVKSAVHNANPISCTKEEWPSVRNMLHDIAGEYIDHSDVVRAHIALEEVKRLDAKLGN